MNKSVRFGALAGAMMMLFTSVSLLAQVPLAEGTVFVNTAVAAWTDANGNSYTPASGNVSVTTGFAAGVSVTSPATVTPGSPSTGNELAFTITNSGNGTDQFSVSTTAGAGLTVSGYQIGSITYAFHADLNAALAATNVGAGDSIQVRVVYTVAPGQGGQTLPLTLTATSVRDITANGQSTTNVIPLVTAGVNVTPDGASVQRLPSNGTTYSMVFVVSNTGNGSDTFTLSAASSNTSVATIGLVTGTGVSGGTVTLVSGMSVDVTVNYIVLDVAAGSTSTISLTATSGVNATVDDDGSLIVTVIRSAVAVVKEALRSDRTTTINSTTDRVIPGEQINYRVTVTNTGTAAASTVVVTDVLPENVSYDPAAGAAAISGSWSFSWDAGTRTLTATLTGTLAGGASASFWIPVTVQ
jgi:uncharacterized repeat protein (TIGR01451 family)